MQILTYVSIAIVTIVLLWFVEVFLKKKWLKYLIVAIPLVIGLISLNGAYNIPSPDFEDLGEFVIGVYCLIIAVLALITSLIIDIIRFQRKKVKR